jgi:hypothetical protein
MKRLLCKLFGCPDLRVIEEYSRKEEFRPLLVAGGRFVPAPHICAKIKGKFQCKRCDKIVTGEFEQKRWLEKSELRQ